MASRQGLVALCRLARFETSDELSKHAALRVLDLLPELKDEAAREDAGKKIIAGSGNGKRTATAWLRTFAKTLPDIAASIPQWEAHIKAEHELFTQFPDRTSREVVRDLYRFEVALMQGLGREPEAVMRKTLTLLEGTEQQLTELMDWLLERKAWPVVQEVAERFPKPFLASAELLYRLAEAQDGDGKMDLAEETAAKALALRPDDVPEHFRLGILLQERGQFTLAENELRYLLPRVTTDAYHQFRVPYALSEMLHDIGRELPAAEVAQGAVEMLAKNAQLVENSIRPQGAWISRMHYFFALDLLENGKLEEARKRLDDGAAADPTDADVLIAMFRAEKVDEAWRASTKKLIAAGAEHFRGQVRELTQQARQAPNEPTREIYNRQLASACNQLAWLVSNTEGDFDEALRCSQQSLELRPETGGYFDTLGRCYFAKRDFANAIKSQLRAVELEPHTIQLRRQLELFKTAQAESQKK